MTRTEVQLTEDINKAIRDSDLDLTALLLDEWSNLSPTSNPDFLELACKIGFIPIVKLLLSRGFVVDVGAVIAACYPCYNFDILQAFLDSGWDINTSFGHMGDLVVMSISSPPPLLIWVLDHGADPNLHRDGLWCTALERAVSWDYHQHAEILINRGAHISNTNALKLAASNGHTKMIELLLEKGAYINEIPKPAHYSGTAILGTALHKAAENGQLAAVQLLLQKGADPSLKNTAGKTAFDLAREQKHMAVAEVLEGRM